MADQASTVSGVHVQAGQVDSNGSRLRDPPSPSGSDAERGHDHAGDRTSQIVNGIRFDAVGSDDLIAIVQSFVECGNSHIVHFLAVDPTVRASRDPAYRAELNGGDINIADGQPVAWSARLKGAFTKRIAGTDALELLCAAGVENGQAHYLYGSTQDVSERLEHHLRDLICRHSYRRGGGAANGDACRVGDSGVSSRNKERWYRPALDRDRHAEPTSRCKPFAGS